MPMMGRQLFVPERPPEGIGPDDEVFYLPATKEIFTDYDKFFERSIHLNSMVWSCSVTGKSGLTFEEALASERAAQESLDSFPECLERPVLFLVGLTNRGRIDDLVSDVWTFSRDRFFVGEVVEVFLNHYRRRARIAKVKCSNEAMIPADLWHEETERKEKKKHREEIVGVAPQFYTYDVELIGDDESDENSDEDESDLDSFGTKPDVAYNSVFRPRGGLTKSKLKLFLKNACDVAEVQWAVKTSVVSDYDLPSVGWHQVFGGPRPIFPSTPLTKRASVSIPPPPKLEPADATGSQGDVKKKKKRKSKKQLEAEQKKAEAKRKKDERTKRKQKQIAKQQEELSFLIGQVKRLGIPDGGRWERSDRLLSVDEINELKATIKTARDEERERVREIKRQERAVHSEWKKPRDDLLCDDLKPLPKLSALQLPAGLTADAWGDCLSILDFFHSFSGLLNLKENITGGKVTLSMLLSALTTHCPQGALTDLFSVLLQAKAARGDEEDGDEANLDNKDELAQDNCDLEHKIYQSAIREATVLHEQIRNTHGVSVRHLPLDGFTLSEMLRLHILTSGYYSGQAVIRFRYTHRGGYRCWDDSGLVFAFNRKPLVEKLAQTSVFDLNVCERVELLKMLCDQLLGFYGFRERLDRKLDNLRSLKTELKQLRNWDTGQEKEAKDARLLMEYVQMWNESREQRKESDQKEQEDEDSKPSVELPSPSKKSQKLRVFLRACKDGSAPLNRRNAANDAIYDQIQSGVQFNELENEAQIAQVRAMQTDYVQTSDVKLTKQIFDLQAKCGLCLLGRDRAFRRYWYIESLGTVLIERPDHSELLSCETPTPLDKVPVKPDEDDIPLKFDQAKADEDLRRDLLACTGECGSCPVHCAAGEGGMWSAVTNAEDLELLMNNLNTRGFRENELLDSLRFLKPRLVQNIEKCPFDQDGCLRVSPNSDADNSDFDANLRDSILDLEEKVHLGGLASLRVPDRTAWRQSLEQNDTSICPPSDVYVGDELVLGADEAASWTRVTHLAVALLRVAQGLNIKFLKLPFAAPQVLVDEERDQKVEGPNQPTPSFESWQRSLLKSSSFSQVALHLSTLEPGVQWKRSLLQVRCRHCRKKGAPDTMVMCSDCDRAYHIACLRRPLSTVPETDWMCPDCAAAAKAKAREEKRLEEERLRQEMEENEEDLFDDERSTSYESEDRDCSTCGDLITGSSFVRCDDCRSYFHRKCVCVRAKPKDVWICADCKPPSPESQEEEEAVVTSSGRVVKKVVRDDFLQPRPLRLNNSHSRLSSGRSSPAVENGFDSERRRSSRKRKPVFHQSDSDSDSNDVRSLHQARNLKESMHLCQKMIEETMRQDDAFFFLNPVDKKEVPDYYTVIKRPMDLRTMLNKVKNLKYDTPAQLVADAKQMFRNCYTYNIEASEVFECAQRLEAYMDEEFENLGFIEDNHNAKRRKPS